MSSTSTDAVVIGLGIAGSSTLWRLAERGARAVGVDCWPTPHRYGASHGLTRIVRATSFEDDCYVPLARLSQRLWRELGTLRGGQLVRKTGLLLLGARDSEVISASARQALAFDLNIEQLDADQLDKRYPYLALPEATVGAFEADAGLVSPEESVSAMLVRAQTCGADVLAPWEAISIASVDGGVEVRSRDGAVLRARHAVVAAGAWLPGLVDVPSCVKVDRLVVPRFQRVEPADASSLGMPPFIHDRIGDGSDDHTPMGGMPGLGSDRRFKVMAMASTAADSIERVDREVSDDEAVVVEQYVRRHHPHLVPAAVSVETCITGSALDGHLIVGPYPRRPAVTVIGGLSGFGFKFAPALGDICADFALAGATAHDLQLFAPDRFPSWDDSSAPLTLANRRRRTHERC